MTVTSDADNSRLHLAKALEDRLRDHDGKFIALARAISAANGIGEGERDAVDRRKLARIVADDDAVVFNIPELRALDRYLESFGQGLAHHGFFLRANILQQIATAGRPVTFVLGSRAVPDPEYASEYSLARWDVRALAEVLRGVNKFAPDVRSDIRDVILEDELELARDSVHSGRWLELLGDDGPSLVFLASGRASHASEKGLAMMVGGIEPYRDGHPLKDRLPFHFVWRAGIDHDLESSFRYSLEEVRGIDPSAAKRLEQAKVSALEIDGRFHLDGLKQGQGTRTYGVCAAQRRPGGQIWLLVAGMTGPATLGTARMTHSLPLGLPHSERGQASALVWAAVETHVKVRQSGPRRGTRRIERQDELIGPRIWKPPTDA